jgi:glycolate oxidase iron-sulfur subunit
MKSRLNDTDRCVMCGLCLPHCPTYALTRQEGDSPRGRISLMQALASGQLKADDHVAAHLDGCLGCRACEAMCPSGVPFGRLMDEGREVLLEMRGKRAGLPALASPLLRAGGAGRAAASVLHFYQRSGIHGALSRLPALARGDLGRGMSLLPRKATPAAPRGVHHPAGKARGRVQVFIGCTGAAFEGGSLGAARDLLLALGYQVEFPGGQGCCGALDRHAGRTRKARTEAGRNLDAFGGSDVPVIVLNSGCRAQLREYPELMPEARPDTGSTGGRVSAFAQRVTDLCGFLLEQDLEALDLVDHPVTVAVHLPCTLRNVLREHGALLEVLHRLPGVRVLELEGNERCCGAAGEHMITHPQMADALLQPKISSLEDLGADAVITGNIGCSLHFQAGLRRQGIRVPVTTVGEFMAARLGKR